ncbi:neutral zinc metallopeptidase [Allopontixanthobacter sp.]|uniref:KPN_02809 family neutral zinc metallopeptidase n=1 Tax=Allopontixanthobacter sp. TaxID=2906452 RepID=UPI002ABCD47E|nr:neutral zinc metallopeptidase [Allopontixanthobacter sp.]MDZ4307879.1 neutral zinc metallopeptidase [Allopontixanthobacter sp.]
MKLNRFNPGSIRVRGGGSSGGGFPGGGGGKIGCGTIVVAAVAYFAFGADPMQTIGAIGEMQNGAPSQQTAGPEGTEVCETGPYALEACNALGSLNETWQPLFSEANIAFQQPVLTLFSGGTRSACGAASSAMGPFYCPADQGIYIDTSFYDTMERRLGAGGDFARYYVMAHEYGHHIQNLTGMANQIRSVQSQRPARANELQVRMELQADCYAGVWAGLNRNLIEPGDMEEGMTAAAAIGDDTLQRSSGQRVSPESFTHGTSAQRMEWLQRGLQTGDEDQCDTFADLQG